MFFLVCNSPEELRRRVPSLSLKISLTHKDTVIQNKKVNELTVMMNLQRVRVE